MPVMVPPKEGSAVIDTEALARTQAIARQAALDLSATMDPSLSSCVDRVLSANAGANPKDPLEAGDLASFLVVAAGIVCRIHSDLRRRTEAPARGYMEHRLRSEMGIDEGLSPDHDSVIEALVAVVLRNPVR